MPCLNILAMHNWLQSKTNNKNIMNLRDMQYIVAVAELRSFSKAAKQCHVSQPTLSGQIKKMEEMLGVPIFERTNKKVIPTDVGAQIIDSARRIMQEAQAIKEAAQSAQNPMSGTFRLGAFPTLSPYLFPELVGRISLEMPKLRLILLEEKTEILLEYLRQGKLDAAFIALPIHDEYLAFKELFVDEFLLAVPKHHPLNQHQLVEQNMLAHYPLLLLEEGHCLRHQALDVCSLYGATEAQDFRATSLETLRQMVRAGTGITLVPQIAIKTQGEDIYYIPFAPPAPSRSIALVWRKTTTRMLVIEKLKHLA